MRATSSMRRRLALVFPGQGSQRVGMAADLLRDWPRVAGDALEEASEATRCDLRRMLLQGPAAELTQTEHAQPALLAHSTMLMRILQAEGVEVESAAFALGHSLGEYSALVATAALPFVDAIRLVHFRGQAMQRAVPRGAGAMAALMPIRPEDAEALCAQISTQTKLVCEVANYNSSKQTVISGAANAVAQAIEQAKAKRFIRRALLLDSPRVPVVWNVEATASRKSTAEICDALTRQVTEPVRWSQSVDYCIDHGVTEFVELGPSGVLSGLIRQHARGVATTSCGTSNELRAFLKTMTQQDR